VTSGDTSSGCAVPQCGKLQSFPIGWLINTGVVYPFNNREMMIDGIPNRPLYFYQKDIIVANYLGFPREIALGTWLSGKW